MLGGPRPKLEQHLLTHQVVLVNDLVHDNQEKVPMRLRRHLYVGDASVLPQVRQLVIVDLDSLRALNT